MPANKLSMRKIKEVLRLKWAHQLSDRKIAQSCHIPRPAVASYVERATLAGLSWPLLDHLTNVASERLLFARLTHFRATAIRYNKRKRNFGSVITLACASIWLPM